METLASLSLGHTSFPPPSPEGELMETKGSKDHRNVFSSPPPSPEGELMETFCLLY